MNNRDLTISPDGTLLLTTVMAPANQFAVILESRKVDGQWQQPEVASFSGQWPDIEPMFSPDGSKLYFASRRPKPGREGEDWDIWFLAMEDGVWGEPINLGAPVNTSGDEFYPSVASNGNLYFTAEREGVTQKEDILIARFEDGQYKTVVPLGAGVNSAGFEFNAFVSPTEDYLIFSAQGRNDDLGRGDLYLSFRTPAGGFGAARQLPAPINSNMLDYCPSVAGDRFYFTSRRFSATSPLKTYKDVSAAFNSPGNGLGNIYSVPAAGILGLAD